MYTESGVNKITDEMLMDSIPYTPLNEERINKSYHVYSVLNLYTMYRDKFFSSIFIRNQFENITHDKEKMREHYKDDTFDFMFTLLSDKVIGNPKLVKDLKSDRRFHRCHEASVGMCLHDDEGIMKILVGYMPCVDREVHHSVIEMIENGREYIIDFTQNLVILKKKYIELYDFRIINEVSSEDLKKDFEIIKEMRIRSPFYLFFRDELINDLKKNSKVLKLEY